MKKILYSVLFLTPFLIFGQTLYNAQLIGEAGFNVPVKSHKTNNQILMGGFIGSDLTGDFPITFKGGNADAILTQYNETDGTINWIKAFQSNFDEAVLDVTTDADGNIYLIGYFEGAGINAIDVDPGEGVYELSVTSAISSRDMFIVKLDANGDFVWAKQVSNPVGAAPEDGTAIRLDSNGNIYITGSFVYADFDPGEGEEIILSTGNGQSKDAFILKLDNDGNFVWVKTLKGTGNKNATNLEIDAQDNLFVIGEFSNEIDLNPSETEEQIETSIGSNDMFLAKYDSDGNFIFGGAVAGTGNDITSDMIMDENYIYITGSFEETIDFNPLGTTGEFTANGLNDGFLVKYSVDGTFINAMTIGGDSVTLPENANQVTFDSDGNLLVSGSFADSVTFNDGLTETAVGMDDAYYLHLDPDFMFQGVYIISGPQRQYIASSHNLDNSHFLGIGAMQGATEFGYPNPVAAAETTAQRTIYSFEFDFGNMATTDINNTKSNFTVYPNPATNWLQLKGESQAQKVQIFNAQGKLVLTNDGLQNGRVNVSFLPKGVYFIQISDENQKMHQTKFIKK